MRGSLPGGVKASGERAGARGVLGRSEIGHGVKRPSGRALLGCGGFDARRSARGEWREGVRCAAGPSGATWRGGELGRAVGAAVLRLRAERGRR